MKSVQFQVYLFALLMVVNAALPAFAHAKKRKKGWRPAAEIVRQVKLTTECEKSVVNMLASDVALSSIARDLGNQFPMDQVKRKLQLLTGELPLKNGFKLTERASNKNRSITRQIIFKYLEGLGLTPYYEDFGNGMNVIAEIAGTDYPDEVLELGAHYDSAGEHVPGADDNGSGLALVLQMAEQFVKAKPKRTIRFVLYDLEEKGLIGSRAHVRELKKDPRLFLGAIVVDMIGYLPKEAKDLLAVAEIGEEPRDTGKDSVWRRALHQLAQAMFFQYERYKDARRLKLSPERQTAKPGTGDHGSYWDAGLPAIFIAAPYEGDYVNPDNHSKDDTVANMNWDYYTEVARFVVEASAWIAGVQVGPENADPKQNQPNEDILLAAGADLIGARIERQEDLVTTTWESYKAPSADDKIFEEIEDTIKANLTAMDENGLVELWEMSATAGPPVMLINDSGRIATVLLPSGKAWNIRNQSVIDFVAAELKILGGLLAKTGSIDPVFMGRGTKDEIRALAKKERPAGARPGQPIRKPAYVMHLEIPDNFLPAPALKRVRETLSGSSEPFRKKHETAKENFKSMFDDEGWLYGGWE